MNLRVTCGPALADRGELSAPEQVDGERAGLGKIGDVELDLTRHANVFVLVDLLRWAKGYLLAS